MSNPKFLVDIDGNAITTDQWYKIMLSDGTELGVGATVEKRMASAPVPSGQGMVVRYRFKENNDTALYRWVEGETGFIRGLRTGLGGTQNRKNLSLSFYLKPRVFAWYDEPPATGPSYGIKAYQLPGNRIALYGLDDQGNALGLRVYHEPTGGLSIRAMGGDWPLSLDVAFVRVDKTFAVNGNPYF
ncbi:hypothetical protein E1B28_003008 [Marasmius oreades]|uniref:Uncharacterized protein n=1 Tax=Marasmius oreades TaxID=181124 RepID=A0A9P7RL92_9AGAR|nr:uncharacterized protein E1B28_003008 [Marasmius oreades]KAG7085447.1 hypothetical protein E1B28_003008 [Marasmius oreades]